MAPAAAEFTVPDDATEQLLRLVGSYAQCPASLTFKTGGVEVVEFKGEKGESLAGVNTAARFIAGMSSSANQLLGDNPTEQAKIAEWLAFKSTELSPLLDEKLEKLNDWLISRTFLVGSCITLADLVVYAAVQPAVSGFPVAQHKHFCNLLRWYDHVHTVADSSSLFPAAQYQKPKFVVPPPPVAPPPKNSAAANGASAPAANGKAGGKDAAAPAAAAVAAAPAWDDKKKDKKKKKEVAPATPSASVGADGGAVAVASTATDGASSAGPTVDVLDIRVGVINKIGPHPNADSLYVEEIDLGEAEPRQVVSGLRKFVTEEAMTGRRVVVVCNLKPAKMRDVMSYGMVLCASNADHTQVDPIIPPEGAAVGERISFEGYTEEPEAQINPKKKIFEKIAPDLLTDAAGVCTYKGVPFMTSKGAVTASLPGAHVA